MENLKGELINYIYKEEIDESFERKFLKLIEALTANLIEEKESFFGYFLLNMKREVDFDLKSPIATRGDFGKFTMIFNPKIFLSCEINEMKALIKHEVYHIISMHYTRKRSLTSKLLPLAIDLAMDLSINQYIRDLPPFSASTKNISMSFDVDLKPFDTFENYAKELDKAIRKKLSENSKNKIEGISELEILSNAHKSWEEFSGDTEALKDLIKKFANSALKAEVPDSIARLISKINEKPQIDWAHYLRKSMGNIAYDKKKTSTRLNRREPNRHELLGELKNHRVKVVVVLDTSASMSTEETKKAMNEILAIARIYKGEVKIIESDNKIRRVYKIKRQGDLKERIRTKGGTLFSPVFEYINRYEKNSYVIYFTDGVGEKELKLIPKMKKLLWVLTGKDKLSLRNSYGRVLRIGRDHVETRTGIEIWNENIKEVREYQGAMD